MSMILADLEDESHQIRIEIVGGRSLLALFDAVAEAFRPINEWLAALSTDDTRHDLQQAYALIEKWHADGRYDELCDLTIRRLKLLEVIKPRNRRTKRRMEDNPDYHALAQEIRTLQRRRNPTYTDEAIARRLNMSKTQLYEVLKRIPDPRRKPENTGL